MGRLHQSAHAGKPSAIRLELTLQMASQLSVHDRPAMLQSLNAILSDNSDDLTANTARDERYATAYVTALMPRFMLLAGT